MCAWTCAHMRIKHICAVRIKRICPVNVYLSGTVIGPFPPWRPHYLTIIFSASRHKTAGYWPIFGRQLSSHFTVNFGKELKIRRRPNKNNHETSASNVWVEIKLHFRSLKRVYLSLAPWKLIEGFWNACDIFTEQNPRRNQLKIMKRSRKNNSKTSGSIVRV